MFYPNASDESVIVTHRGIPLSIPIENNLTECLSTRGGIFPYDIKHVTYVSDGNKVKGSVYFNHSVERLHKDNVIESTNWISTLKVNLSKVNLSNYSKPTLDTFVDLAINAINGSIKPPFMIITNLTNLNIDNRYQISQLDYSKQTVERSPGFTRTMRIPYTSVFTVVNDTGYVITAAGTELNSEYIMNVLDSLVLNNSISDSTFIGTLKGWEFGEILDWQKREVDPIIDAFPGDLITDIFGPYRSPFNEPEWEKPLFAAQIAYTSTYGAIEKILNQIVWNNSATNWDRSLYQGPPGSENRVYILYNQTNISNGTNYVNFEWDLRSLNYPDKYQILFYVIHNYINDYGSLCAVTDISDWAFVPPPEFNITASSPSLQMIPGDDKNIKVKVRSNTEERFNITFAPSEKLDGVVAGFVPWEVEVPNTGEGSSDLRLIALENASIGSHSLPVDINMVFNSSAFLTSLNETISNPSATIISKRIPLMINIMPPEFNITANPPSLEMRPGDRKNVDIEVRSGTNLPSNVTFIAKNTSEIQVSFIPNAIIIPPSGIVTTTLRVSADLDAQAKSNSLLYLVNFTTLDPWDPLLNSSNHKIPKMLAFPVTVLPPLTIPEYLEIASNWFTSLNSIWAFIAAIGAVTASFITRIYTRKQEQKKKDRNTTIDDYGA